MTEVDDHGRCDVRKGDSGGPQFVGQEAAGLTSRERDDGNCNFQATGKGDFSYFSNIDLIDDYLGLHLFYGS